MRLGRNSLARPFRRYLIAKCLIASVVAWPVMTLVLQSKGLSYLEIGLLNSFGAVVSLVSEVPMGRLADRFGQKYALTSGALLIALGLSVLGVFSALPAVYLSELIIGLGLALSTGADSAWLFQEHKRLGLEDNYLKSRSVIGSVSLLFSMSSSVIGPMLFSWGAQIPLWTSVACYVAAACVWLGLRIHRLEPLSSLENNESSHITREPATIFSRTVNVLRNHRLFVSLALASTIVVTAVSNYSTYIGPFLESRGLQVKYLGWALILGKIAQWLATRNAYRLKRSTDQARLRVIATLGCAILVLIGLSVFAPSTPWLGVSAYVSIVGLSSLFFILIDEQVNLSISDKSRTTMLSVVAMFDEASTIALDPLIGAALDALGFSRTYLLLAAILCVMFGITISFAIVSTRERF